MFATRTLYDVQRNGEYPFGRNRHHGQSLARFGRPAAGRRDLPSSSDDRGGPPVQATTSNRPILTATGLRLLERRIARLDDALAELRHAIDDRESRTETFGAYLRKLRERDRLRAVLRDAELVEDAFADDPAIVEIGDRVIVRWDDGTAESYILAHPAEAAFDAERVAIDAPLGRALLFRRVGDIVWVDAPRGSHCCRILTAARAAVGRL
jgi:transcription elongation GreA/GreB family factor